MSGSPSRSTRTAATRRQAAGVERRTGLVLQRCGDGRCACNRCRARDDAVRRALDVPGRALDAPLRLAMESRFGFDFSGVRLHTHDRAAESADVIGARAYTVGSHIAFAAGRYEPATSSGRRLLEHELTHVLQQATGRVPEPVGGALAVVEDPALEREAAAGRQSDGAVRRAAPGRASGRAIQRDPQDALRRQTCEAAPATEQFASTACSYRAPENCPSYQEWVVSFTGLQSFAARASPTPSQTPPHVFDVLGGGAAARDPIEPTPRAERPAPRVGSARLGEQFIDHPTDTWVNHCLPANLRATAYQLPSDCADIAVILRHVWLAAHHRTEGFGSWTIGDRAGEVAQARIAGVISAVGTENVAAMVNPYSDAAGSPILAFDRLDPLLHPGDVLVWAHFDKGFDRPRTGGHTHTISGVDRDESGRIVSLRVLQGNLPIFGERGEPGDDKGAITRELRRRDTPGLRRQLGVAPGRRIERDVLRRSEGDFGEHSFTAVRGRPARRVWRWGAHTLLVAAGPARAAPRPRMQTGSRVRQLTDWVASFDASGNRDQLLGAWEGMLGEARATIDGGGSIPEADARRTGAAAGRAVWRIAAAARDRGDESHFWRINELNDLLTAYRFSDTAARRSPRAPIVARLREQLRWIRDAFHDAARGGAEVSFRARVPRGVEAVNVLVTGFDPFVTATGGRAPVRGDWNPSGAAALALDGERISLGRGAVAAVEALVLPVRFDLFAGGMVERLTRPHAADLDAVLTVSVAPSIMRQAGQPPSPVRLERYAVGVHMRGTTLEPVAAAPGGGGPGQPIIESTAPLAELQRGIERPARGRTPAIDRPTIGENVTFQFARPADAQAALRALQSRTSAPVGRVEGRALVVVDAGAIAQITSTMRRTTGPSIEFTAAGRRFTAAVRSGPGGDFLSNEVSFRMLRLLAETASPREPISFHTHTEPGNVIPQDTSTAEARAERRAALDTARDIRERLIRTLRRTIEVVGGIVLRRRRARRSGGSP